MTADAMLAIKGELKMQCFRAMNAAEDLERLLRVRKINFDSTDTDGMGKAIVAYMVEVWSRVHGILAATGVVSRILWPNQPSEKTPRNKRELERQQRAAAACARAREIWTTWTLPSEESLAQLKSRAARNASEHAENGASDWIASFGKHEVRAYAIGSTDAADAAQTSKSTFRYLDKDSFKVKIGDDTADLRALVAALTTLQAAIPFTASATAAGVEFVPLTPATMPSPGVD